MEFIQKQLICDNTIAGQKINSVIHFTGVLPLQHEGRIMLKFNSNQYKINLFQMIGIRLKTRFTDPLPATMFYDIDTPLSVKKIILVSTTNPNIYFLGDENQAIILPLDYYDCFVYLKDYDDTLVNNVTRAMVDFHNELEMNLTTGVQIARLKDIDIHHLPGYCYYQDIVNYNYQSHYIKANVIMENIIKLPDQKK